MSSREIIVSALDYATQRTIQLHLRSNPHDSGVIVNQQKDSWARGFSVDLEGRDSDTKAEMRRVRRRNGWRSDSYYLRARPDGIRIAFRGLNRDSLPDGKYRFKLHIDGYRTRKWLHLDLKGPETVQGAVFLTLNDQRRVQVDMRKCDRSIRRLLEESMIDFENISAVDWLKAPARDERRKACLLNVLAKLRSLDVDGSLLDSVVGVSFVNVDRVYAKVRKHFVNYLDWLVDTGAFQRDKGHVHDTHKRVLDHAKVARSSYKLVSFRQQTNPSLQLTVATPKTGGKPVWVDMDIDYSYPDIENPVGTIVHVGEVLNPAKTNHLNLWRNLKQTGVSRFLCYEVVR